MFCHFSSYRQTDRHYSIRDYFCSIFSPSFYICGPFWPVVNSPRHGHPHKNIVPVTVLLLIWPVYNSLTNNWEKIKQGWVFPCVYHCQTGRQSRKDSQTLMRDTQTRKADRQTSDFQAPWNSWCFMTLQSPLHSIIKADRQTSDFQCHHDVSWPYYLPSTLSSRLTDRQVTFSVIMMLHDLTISPRLYHQFP